MFSDIPKQVSRDDLTIVSIFLEQLVFNPENPALYQMSMSEEFMRGMQAFRYYYPDGFRVLAGAVMSAMRLPAPI